MISGRTIDSDSVQNPYYRNDCVLWLSDKEMRLHASHKELYIQRLVHRTDRLPLFPNFSLHSSGFPWLFMIVIRLSFESQ